MNQSSFTYPYPHPALTADCILIAPINDTYQILLIQRRNPPCQGMWAFPGGFMNIDETLHQAAQRELLEETGLSVNNLQALPPVSTVNRDPRERVITTPFWAITTLQQPSAGDDAHQAQWFPLNQLPPLAFDHTQILYTVLHQIQRIIQLPRITPDYIQQLQPGQIFVFGSNLDGAHAGGAARIAHQQFGAIWGQGVGIQGSSYAIPTMQGGVETIKPYVDQFIAYACQHPEYQFLVTPIGCGIAGFSPNQIAPLFAPARYIANITLPKSFQHYL